MEDKLVSTQETVISSKNNNVNKLELSPETLEALKTLSSMSSTDGIQKLSNCDKLTASLEQIRANKNMRLLEKLDKIKQDFTTLNKEIAQIEESILDVKEVTSNLVKSLPPDREIIDGQAKY